jgi:hypothetical protein
MTTYKQSFLLPLVCLATAALCAPLSHAATSSSNPVADAFVTTGPSPSPSPGFSSNNYGGASLLAVAASGNPKGEFQSVMRFDLTSAVSTFDTQFGAGLWSIQSVTLQLTAENPANQTGLFATPPSAGNFSISWMQNNTWVEGTGTPAAPTTVGITFATLNSFIGAGDEDLGTFAYSGATSGSNSYTLNLTSGFTTNLLAGGPLSFRFLAADSSVSYLFDSRSAGTTANRPVLTVTAVPEPSSIALGVLGVSLLVGWKLRRQ